MYNYNEELKIDVFALHKAAQEQHVLLMKYAEAYAKAKKILAAKERELKVRRAQIGKETREAYAKITADAVKEIIEIHPDVVRLEQEAIDCAYHANLMWSAVEAFKDRKYEISEIIDLYKIGYFSQSMGETTGEFVLQQAATEQDRLINKAGEEVQHIKKRLIRG